MTEKPTDERIEVPGWAALIEKNDRLLQALSSIQFDLINCHEVAGRNACAHIKDAVEIVNRTLRAEC